MPDRAEPTAPAATPPSTPGTPPNLSGERVDAAELAASEADALLVRDTRRRLVAFSGGSTLLVLLALGVLLYAAVANTLAAASVGQLEARTNPVAAALQGQQTPGNAPDAFGFQPGRGNTFLFAFDSEGDAVQLGRERVVVLAGMPNLESLAAARTAIDGRNVWIGQLDLQATTFPVRILTQR